MAFINPLEILNLGKSAISSIDTTSIKKAKRKLFAEMELSDDEFYSRKGSELSRSQIEEVIHLLDDEEKKEFFYFIINNEKLQNFLSENNNEFILNFRSEAIYKLPSFISFISMHFAESFNSVIFKSYLKGSNSEFATINSIKLIITLDDQILAYKNLTRFLSRAKDEIDEATAKLRDKSSQLSRNQASAVFEETKLKLKSDKLNLLPSTFQEMRNQVAMSLRNFSVNVYNFFDGYLELSLEVILYARSFEVNGITEQQLTVAFDDLNNIREENEEKVADEPIVSKYVGLLENGNNIKTRIKLKLATGKNALNWVNANISIAEINDLPARLNEIKISMAILIKELSIVTWNESSDIDSAVLLIVKAIEIEVNDSQITANFLEARKTLLDLKLKVNRNNLNANRVRTPTPTFTPAKDQEKNNSGCGILILIIVIIAIVVAIINGSKGNSNTYNTPSANISDTSEIVVDSTAVNTNENLLLTPKSKYAGNRLKTGASPFNDCFGSGSFEGNSYLKVQNDNTTDAIIMLIEEGTERIIRNEYLRAGKFFKLKKIPSGLYFLKIYSGTDWNPQLDNTYCNSSGGFEDNVSNNSSVGIYNSLLFTDDGYTYTTYNLKLSNITN